MQRETLHFGERRKPSFNYWGLVMLMAILYAQCGYVIEKNFSKYLFASTASTRIRGEGDAFLLPPIFIWKSVRL